MDKRNNNKEDYQKDAKEMYKFIIGSSLNETCQNATHSWGYEEIERKIRDDPRLKNEKWMVDIMTRYNNMDISDDGTVNCPGNLYIRCNLTGEACNSATREEGHFFRVQGKLKCLVMQELDSDAAKKCMGYNINKDMYDNASKKK